MYFYVLVKSHYEQAVKIFLKSQALPPSPHWTNDRLLQNRQALVRKNLRNQLIQFTALIFKMKY